MRVSLEWLSEYVDVGLPARELADLLSMSGTAVDRVLPVGKGVSGVVVGRVVRVRPHPAADNLSVAMVEDGTMVREIVCGAPNCVEGMKTALALPGARLPAISDREMSRATIRGIASDGMMCSSAELGIGENATGIIELDPQVPVGSDIHEVLPLEDVILDLEVTPNRPDCMSVVGVAREVAALTGASLRRPSLEAYETGEPVDEMVKVFIKDPRECPRYTARVVTGVKVAPSPPWMQRRLIAGGLRPINNIVDATNYVLLELGQPLHAFDLDLLGERTIVVRLARHGEFITTLDGIDRQLDDQALVIADISRPVALAGVMGGLGSEVTGGTTNVLIESACFEPTSILRTSKRLGIRTEASSIFERGSDPNGTTAAARRAADLMVALSGGGMAAGDVDVYPREINPVTVDLRPARANRILGTGISRAEMFDILERLEMKVEDSEVLGVTVPTFRGDIEREIDLIEEIARVYGYGRIESALPAGGGVNAGLSDRQELEAALVDALAAQGLSEAVTVNFMRLSDLEILEVPGHDRMRRTVALLNPLAETGEVMRSTILPGLIRVASGNINRGNRNLALFERGRVFVARGEGELPEEIETVGVLMCGLNGPSSWDCQGREIDFYDLKGAVENVADALGVAGLSFEPAECPYLAPGRCARLLVGGEDAGIMGRLHPRVVSAFDLDGELYVCELFTDRLLDAAAREREYRRVGRFPNVKVDISIVVDEALAERLVEDEIWREGGELLQSVRLFDVYRGPQIPEGKKSLAHALEFGSAGGTLTDDEAHGELKRIITAIESAFGARLRGKEPEPGEEA